MENIIKSIIYFFVLFFLLCIEMSDEIKLKIQKEIKSKNMDCYALIIDLESSDAINENVEYDFAAAYPDIVHIKFFTENSDDKEADEIIKPYSKKNNMISVQKSILNLEGKERIAYHLIYKL
jgi:hypothetical protein